ncbi:unnamed protein product [Leptidea sinapis]|uniref:J domain-containing protein n=1 Tax=Leptidea sinapis TaxID=189913 RepID=A0A5E4QZS1_9NEOP|nr:unnamed protein product [Leptidea sinapis]
MARSTKDDPRFTNSAWNYHVDAGEKCGYSEITEPPLTQNTNVMNNSLYTNVNFGNEVYNQYNMQPAVDSAPNVEEKPSFNPNSNVNLVQPQNYGNAMLNLGNGQLVRVIYDENNQQLIFPMSGQYELFSSNHAPCEVPLHQPQPAHMFTLNQNCTVNNNSQSTTATIQNTTFSHEGKNQAPTSNFLKEVLGNWEPNSSGTYSPFGQNYPLNHPDSPMNVLPNSHKSENISHYVQDCLKRNENSPLAETSTKKRIVAEVKPMRPSYSDVLSKNSKNTQPDVTKKVKSPNSMEPKLCNKTSKSEKISTMKIIGDENKYKIEKKKLSNTISSGSDSGDFITDDNEKYQKCNKKSKSKRNNMSRKWSSLDDITNEDENNGHQEKESQFVFIKNQTEKSFKKVKKTEKVKSFDEIIEDIKHDDEMNSQFVLQDNQNDPKIKKKKEKSYHKATKLPSDKKKPTQPKVRRNKPGYLGLAQNYLEHWGGASWKALVWFLYLLSDVCRMSCHLIFDVCTSVFTQCYVSSQAVWRSCKDWLNKLGDNKYITYIDRKFGHSRFAFWRKMKWFKKEKDAESDNESNKLYSNIQLPATGEEAMKRLLACQGKDPYSILGVSETCSDEEIKRYYRRQAFLVHPDKNQQPGAEEAFKILQHAFDLIGEPERREQYERKAQESRHVEAAWSEFSDLIAQLHDKMECTNCGRRHKRVATERPCYAARYCAQCKIRHSAKESSMWGLVVMYYACMDGAVYQITQWASCQKKNLKQLRPDCHIVQYRIA